MIDEDWTHVERMLASWPRRAGSRIDFAIYRRMLQRFTGREVVDAIVGLGASQRYMPSPAEIAQKVIADMPPPDGSATAVSEKISQKRAHIEEIDRCETERRGAELQALYDSDPKLREWGEALLRRLRIKPETSL